MMQQWQIGRCADDETKSIVHALLPWSVNHQII